MSRLTKKDQGILSIKGREIESWNSQELAQELHYPKAENQLPSQIDGGRTGQFWTISLQ